ncbi:hypothetical protein UFOVP252_60 [uncultured Caudovirales phage]|uniref:Uncharacterized protein n=1 Tax=uncultured Caudovirales phage TaxID=2100421 RepID=A0A6J5LG20_9CAUD|nr:hypothetical protein UFOVP252_60 [uncultured Caudovirales phage]
MTFGTVATVVGIAGGINSLTGGGVSSALGFGPKSATGAEAQQMADPFASYRGNLAAMYSGALQPGAPSNIEAMPGYSQYKTGVLDPAMKASERAAAKTGMLYSGNEQQALQSVGQQGYYGFMTDYLNRLAQGSGATQNPAQAAGMGLAQAGQNQQGFMQGLGALGTSASSLAGQFGGIGGAGGSGLSATQMGNLSTQAMNYADAGAFMV